jgi:hypothetical protein
VEVEALGADASFMDFLRTSAVVLHPDGSTEPLLLQQTGPGRYRGEFRTQREGAYLVNINLVGGSADAPMQGNIQAAVSVPYPREFRAVKHNGALLSELAERTGGRELGGADPTLVDLFDRGELGVPKSPRSVWDLLAILAAALFLLDVAGRRIAVDRKAVAAALSRAMGRPADVGTETLAAWKRVAGRRDKGVAAGRFEATEQEAQTAIDVEAEVSGTPKVTGVKRPPGEPEPEAPPEEGDYTSRLLAAKRRARGKARDSGEDDPGA